MNIFSPSSIPLRLPFAQYRNYNSFKPIKISNPSSGLTNYQIKIELNENNFPFSKCRDDGDDIKFFSDNGKILSFWIESWSSSSATIWVKIDEILAYADKIIWLVYGNSSASSVSDGDDTFELFDDFEGISFYSGSWTTKATMTHAVADVPCVSYNNKLYCFGGYDNAAMPPGSPQNYTQEYNPNTWTDKTAMPTARWGAAAALHEGKAYVFGGAIDEAGSGSNKCECYDISGNSWTTKTNLPAEIDEQGLMAVTVGSKIYLFYRQYTYEFDPAGNAGAGSYTQKLSTNPVDRTWTTCAYVNISGEDRIYLIGGYNYGVSGGTNKNYYYKPATNTWSGAQVVAPYASWGPIRESCIYNGEIYYGFGQEPFDTYFTHLYRYNPSDDTWSSALTEATYARDGAGAGIINDKLYVVGGRANSAGFNYTEEFDPTTNQEYSLDTDKWNEDNVAGSSSFANSIITLVGNAGANMYTITSKNGFSPNIVLRTKSKIGATAAASQITDMGWGASTFTGNAKDQNDLTSVHGTHYAGCGNDIDYTLTNIGATHFGDWYTYEFIRLSTSTKFYKNGSLINDCNLDLNGNRYPFFSVRDSEYTIQSDWILVRKYASPEPTVTVL